ncbi:MAG: M16 family metallopeptidase [Brevinematia bacterium]
MILFLVLLFVFVGSGFGDSFMDLNEFYLDNGLKVILVKRDILPIVSVQLWYKVGAVDEVDGKSGIAHFLEHMAFKGTKNLKPGEFSKIVRSLGGEDNAATSWDYTFYYVDVPSEYTVKVLEMLKEMMFDIKFDYTEFEREKKVILEERRMRYEDDPFGQFFEDFLLNSFKRINYRRPIIGWEKDIKSLTLGDLIHFYNTYYSPKNATLIVVGNIDKEYVSKEIARIFSESSKNLTQKEENVENIAEFNVGKIEFKTVRKDAKSRAVIIGFRTPSYRISKKDVASLEVLEYILADGRGSRLFKDLVVSKKLVSSVSGGMMLGKYPFLIYFFAIANPDVSLSSIRSEMISCINSIQKGVLQEELKVAKKKIKAERIYELQKNKGIASSFGWSEVVLGDYRELDNFIKVIDEVTEEDVIETFKKYFSENNMIVGVLEN